MSLNGIDISGNQPDIDLSRVPCDFVGIKATGSTSFISPSCDRQFQQAKSLDLLRLIYHFLRDMAGPAGDAVVAADFFVDNCLGYFDGQTIPVLDWESVVKGDPILGDTGWALRWLNRVHERTGIKPIIYMSSSVANEHDWSDVVAADYAIWVAAYVLGYQRISGYNVPSGLAAINHWPSVAMWQYTSTGQLSGYDGNLDLNVFYGDREAWLKYAAKNGTVTAAPAPAPTPAPAPAPAPTAGGTCVVVSGDTLWGISQQVGVSLGDLEAVNPGIDYNRLDPGQIINLPAGADLSKLSGNTTPAAATVGPPPSCIVDAGDSLSSIGIQFGVPWQTIASLNGIGAPYIIHPGQVLRLR